MRKWHQVLYGAFAVFWIAIGVSGIAGFATGSADEVHQSRELGAFAVFLGWMHVWCMRHHERRLPVHAGLVLFAALMSGIHWREWLVGARTVLSPLVNSVPFVVLAAMWPSGNAQAPSTQQTNA